MELTTSRAGALAVRIAAIAGITVVAVAPMAAAHIEPDPDEAPRGGEATVTFRVPNERDDASTTSVQFNLPTDTPIASVSVQPVPGWRYETETTTLDEPVETDDGEVTEAITSVTFTGGEIGPGEFQQFDLALGPLPEDADQVVFPTLQTYDDGDVVRWIDQPTEDGTEPEHPAPVLTLTDAEADHHADTSTSDEETADATGGETASAANVATEDDVNTATTVGVIGTVVGALALVVAIVALVLSRRRPA